MAPGILGVSNHAFRVWIEAQPNLMHCNPERRNTCEACLLAGLVRFGFSSNLLHPKHSARPLRNKKRGGRHEPLYISAGMASSIASACRRPGLGTRHRPTAVRLPWPPRDRAIGDTRARSWMLRPGAQIAQVPRQIGWVLQDSAPMRHSMACWEGTPARDRNSCRAPPWQKVRKFDEGLVCGGF